MRRGEFERLQLARRAFYFKTGQAVLRPSPYADWRHREMLRQCTKWGWDDADIAQLDTRPVWKLDRVVEERNALVSELSRSYRLLTEFAREQNAVANLDTRELALLGRKLYAALDKRPGKIDRVNPGISRDLSERTLWLRRSEDEPVRWQLFLHPPEELPQRPAKTSISLVEILTWLHINGICERGTRIHHLPKPGPPPVSSSLDEGGVPQQLKGNRIFVEVAEGREIAVHGAGFGSELPVSSPADETPTRCTVNRHVGLLTRPGRLPKRRAAAPAVGPGSFRAPVCYATRYCEEDPWSGWQSTVEAREGEIRCQNRRSGS